MTPITNHFNLGLVKLIAPFFGKPRIASLMLAMMNRVQELEDATWDVLERYTIDGADDARLDVLGRVVGQPNLGWITETYRAVLRGKIRANRSRGLAIDIVEVCNFVTPTDEQVLLLEPGYATLIVQPQFEVDADIQAALVFLLPKTRAAGVQMHVAFAPESATGTYEFGVDGVVFDDLTDPGTFGPGFFDARTL